MPHRFYRGLTVVVTGGAGFLGSHLVEHLLDLGAFVTCLDDFSTGYRANLPAHDRLVVIEHDVSTPFATGAADLVFHLAGTASPAKYQAAPVKTLLGSVQGAHQALEFGRAHGARVLLASTSEVYGDPKVHPQTESYTGDVNVLGPRACYDEGKRCAETLFSTYHREYGTDIRIARIFNTYGPRMAFDDGRVVPSFLAAALNNRPLPVAGSGQQTRSLCYVDDMVRGLLCLMASATVGAAPINLGNPEEVTINELAALVIALTGSTGGVVHIPGAIDDPQLRCPDIGAAKRGLNWAPEIALRDGMALTIAQIQQLCLQ